MPFDIVRKNITKMYVDAIVNAANTELKQGGGVCGAIFEAAGAEDLQAECDKLAPIKMGEAVITSGGALHAKHIIHAAGPVYRDGKHGEEALLRACYANSLKLAAEHGCESVAFPLISSGIYGYPKSEALRVATSAIQDFLLADDGDMDVSLVVFDKTAFQLSKKLRKDVQSFIDENYIEPHDDPIRRRRQLLQVERDALSATRAKKSAGDKFELDESFSESLIRLIAAKGKKEPEVYKKANIDRKLFSKIRSNPNYNVSKRTALALAVALELSQEETLDLLGRAGFALSRSVLSDVIAQYFIVNRKYDIFEINDVLFDYNQPTLGV